MARKVILMIIFIFECLLAEGIILVVPEDVPAGFAAIYGFSPRLKFGNDQRVGFGFRFGNHADFQLLYEFGPQLVTKPLAKTNRIRSASYTCIVRRRPLLDFLVNLGLVKQISYRYNVVTDSTEVADDEPR
ncbi:uncharacterized protein LOC113521150 [Galleria mellonella]|uniref:Uncharacterized protein LOC113521150 n=1 Tax=Galleria mellonella TaxID=7137 RepID=A0ABM3MD90_GALME|nr:uncharacterized protein LOC113521150 [Galleria mellonella]